MKKYRFTRKRKQAIENTLVFVRDFIGVTLLLVFLSSAESIVELLGL